MRLENNSTLETKPMKAISCQEAVEHLQSLGQMGIKLGLERMRLLIEALDNPQQSFDTVHIVGTNGKTSTARIAAYILAQQGLRVGAYCSPHISGFCERVQVQSEDVGEQEFANAVGRAAVAANEIERELSSGDRVTQFELLTATAFLIFEDRGIDVALIEAGLGGRYDATNVLRSKVQALTNISLEHTRWLGSTEREICDEKLAVVPQSGYLVSGELSGEVADRVKEVTLEREVTVKMAGEDFFWDMDQDQLSVSAQRTYANLPLRLRGRFQRDNFALAVAVAEAYHGELDGRAVHRAAQNVRLPGRLETVRVDPLTVIDGAHNPAAMQALRQSLDELIDTRGLISVVSILDDKDAPAMLRELVPICENIVCTRSSHERSVPADELAELCRSLGFADVFTEENPCAALALAGDQVTGSEAVLICGSLYLLADLESVTALRDGRLLGAA